MWDLEAGAHEMKEGKLSKSSFLSISYSGEGQTCQDVINIHILPLSSVYHFQKEICVVRFPIRSNAQRVNTHIFGFIFIFPMGEIWAVAV